MSFRLQIVFKAAALILVLPQFVCAQDPLRVEVVGNSHPNLEPITVRVTNITSKSIDLPIPYNVLKNAKESFPNPLPVDIEKLEGDEWIKCRPLTGHGVSREIKAGKTIEFTLGILGPGQYRARVWYTIDHGDPNPPKRNPVFESVISQPFSVTPNPAN